MGWSKAKMRTIFTFLYQLILYQLIEYKPNTKKVYDATRKYCTAVIITYTNTSSVCSICTWDMLRLHLLLGSLSFHWYLKNSLKPWWWFWFFTSIIWPRPLACFLTWNSLPSVPPSQLQVFVHFLNILFQLYPKI